MKSILIKNIARLALVVAAIPILAGCFTLEYSPDGTKLVFLWADPRHENKMSIALCNVDGSGFRQVPNSVESTFGHWSPDGSKIAFAGEKGIWSYDLATNKSKLIWAGYGGELAWVSDHEIVIQAVEQRDGNEQSKLIWFDVAANKVRQQATIEDRSEMVRDLVPIPRTDGMVFLGSGDLYLAEFGEAKKITTTGDVVGFTVNPESSKVTYARKSKNAQYILLSLYEFDLRLRSIKKIPFPDRVPNVNPAPRIGPKEISYVRFAKDGSHMLVFAMREPNKGNFKVFDQLFWVRLDGTEGRLLVDIAAGSAAQGMMGAIAPDSQSIAALYTTKDSITLASYPVNGGPKRILSRSSAPKE